MAVPTSDYILYSRKCNLLMHVPSNELLTKDTYPNALLHLDPKGKKLQKDAVNCTMRSFITCTI
jgi:hypothetical protein